VEALPDMVFRISRDWKFLDVHTPQEDMLLLPSCEFLGRCVNEVMPPELSVPLYETTERVRREKIPQIYEYQLEVKGGLRDYEARIVPGHGTDILVVVRDVSESKLLDKMKNEFVSTISHELRTPLTAIRGTLGLLAAGVLGTLETEAQSLVEAALHNSERLGRLINDILELDRVSHRGFELTVSAQSLAPLIERAIIESAVFAAEYQVTYSVSELVRTARASIDTDRFLQVMSNLLSNAAKYGDSCEVVTVGLERSGTSWRVYVRNRGAPIPPSFRRRIFSRFAVVDGTDMRSHQGTGLGLAISKVLMERMGGRIDYQSTSAFTEFFLEFPVVIDD
jgi:signal transduction histidine kinase